MIQIGRYRGMKLIRLACDDCGAVGPAEGAPQDEREWDAVLGMTARPLGWTAELRRPLESRPFIAAMCPRCSGTRARRYALARWAKNHHAVAEHRAANGALTAERLSTEAVGSTRY